MICRSINALVVIDKEKALLFQTGLLKSILTNIYQAKFFLIKFNAEPALNHSI